MTDLNHRYYLFVESNYYPSGGLADVHSTSDDYEDLIRIGTALGGDACYVWDRLQPADDVWDFNATPQRSPNYIKWGT